MEVSFYRGEREDRCTNRTCTTAIIPEDGTGSEVVPEDINFVVVRKNNEGEYAAMMLDHLGHAISGYL
jgi:hypothetical protein